MERIIEPSLNKADDEETLTNSGFYWRENAGVKVLVCKPLEDIGFENGFSTRLGGVSRFPNGDLNLAGYDGDSRENIEENRRRFLSAFNGSYSLATVWQVHGDAVKPVRSMSEARATEDRADAVVSDLDGILACVKTADCVPILLGDPTTGAYAAVHAGWRGTVATIVAKAVSLMGRAFGSNSADILAAIGPAAACESYEVGQDVIDAFGPDGKKYFQPTRDGHALVDLKSANRDQLIECGVQPKNIYIAPFCTMSRTDLFFSYRIEKRQFGKTGRLLSVIGKRSIDARHD